MSAQLLVFVTETDDGGVIAPTLFVPDRPDAVLPPHPLALTWRYFATISEDDDLLPIGGREGLELEGHYISSQMI